jgi:hypothetical protein
LIDLAMPNQGITHRFIILAVGKGKTGLVYAQAVYHETSHEIQKHMMGHFSVHRPTERIGGLWAECHPE